MTVVANQNNPASEKQVRVDVTRPKSVFTSSEVYKNGDNRFTGTNLPNAGDRIQPHWFEHNRHMLVTATNPKDLSWVYETAEGLAFDANAEDVERDRINLQPPAEEQPLLTGAHTEGMAMVDVPVRHDTDKGLAGKARLAARRAAHKTAQMIRWCIAAAISLTIICAALVVTYGYKTMEIGRDPFLRTCSVKLSNGTEITGKREYLQKFHKVFGFKIVDTQGGYEKTTLDVRSVAMTVVGQYTKVKPVNPEDNTVPAPEERWWSAQMEAGDKERLVLRGADNYTFVAGKGVAVVKYEEFCKGL